MAPHPRRPDMTTESSLPRLLDERISAAAQPLADTLSGVNFYAVPVGEHRFPLIVGWLIAAALVFTVYFRGIPLRGFGHAIDVVWGCYTDPNHPGGSLVISGVERRSLQKPSGWSTPSASQWRCRWAGPGRHFG